MTNWSKKDDAALARMKAEGVPNDEIAHKLRRSARAVEQRINKLGVATRKVGEVPNPDERPDPTNVEIRRLESELLRVKMDLRDAESKLKIERREQTLFAELAAVIRGETKPLAPITPIRVPDKPAAKTQCDAVLILSDEHSDQVVTAQGTWGIEQYDFNIFRCRLHRLLKLTTQYVTTLLPAHAFHRLWVLGLGDSVNGDIHGAGPKNHHGNTIKAALALGDTEAQFVQALEPYFPGGVHVIRVSGNHPRRTMKKDYGGPHDNFDYLAGVQMATRLDGLIQKGRVSVHLPEAWTAFVNIRGRIWAMNHGDDVKGTWGIPWYGFERKNNRVQAMVGQFDEKVSYFCYGHYHTDIDFKSAGATSLHSGAWPMTDPFAINSLSIGQEPVQTLYVVNDERGILLPVPIFTRDRAKEASYLAGEWEPELGKNLVIEKVTPRTEGFQLIQAPAA